MFKHRKSLVWLITLLMVMALALTACNRGGEETPVDDPPAGGDEAPAPTPEPEDDDDADATPDDIAVIDDDHEAEYVLTHLRELEALFPMVYNNPNPIIPGGTFNWARGQASGFPGLFHPQLSSDAADSVIGSILMYPLISINDAMEMTQDGIVTWVKCLDEYSFTMTMRPGLQVFWSDGVELTLDDLLYAYYFVSHPDYTGVRFGLENSTRLVVGAEAFKEGEVDYIEGLVLSECKRELKIYFTAMPPSMLFSGAILSTPLPRHHFEGIPVADTAGHINSRDNLIGFGPFVIDTVVAGETVLLRANENYWQGRPYLDYILYEIVPPAMMGELMRSGLYDRGGMRHVDFPDYYDSNNVQLLGRIGGSQGFFYFALGAQRRCEETAEIYFIPRYDNHPITNRYVRRAIAYAMDHHTLNMTIHNGLRTSPTTVLHPFNTGRWIDPYSRGTSAHDPDRANQLLDDAGFAWGPDGFRLDLDGNPFYINFGFRPNPGIDEILFSHYQENMREIGIDLRLWDDHFIDHNVLVARNITGDEAFELSPNDDIHFWHMTWSMGANPNPHTLWGHNAIFNLSNFTNDTFQSILADIASTAAWDPVFLQDAYTRWAAAFEYYMPAVYEMWPIVFDVVNNRVAGWTLSRCTFGPDSFSWHRVGLTAEERYVHQ